VNVDAFWTQLLAPFVLFAMLLAAWPIKRWVQLKMKDGKLKQLLLRSW
jgi:hypothetical protein